jgi:hypothetical protein
MKNGIKTAVFLVSAVFFTGVTAFSAEQALKELKVMSCAASTTQTKDMLQGENNVNASNVLDNNPATRWSSEFLDNQWLILELNKKSNIKQIQVNWEVSGAKSYSILVSNNKKDWTEVYATENSAGGHEQVTLEKAVKAKFVKLELKTRKTDWGFSIEDIHVLGN